MQIEKIQATATRRGSSLAPSAGNAPTNEPVIIYSDIPIAPDYGKYGLGKHFMCIGHTEDNILVFEKLIKSKYDDYEYTTRYLADTKDFNYWQSANDSEWCQTHIWPSRKPGSGYKPIFEKYTRDDGTISEVITNHDSFFSRESLCMFEKYGVWPITDLDFIPKEKVSIISITILRPKPLITCLADLEEPTEWAYIKDTDDVAIYTGEIKGHSRNFEIKDHLKGGSYGE